MPKRDLPVLENVRPIGGINFQVLPRAFERWNPGVHAADGGESDRTISIYDVIGYDFFGDGVTARRIAGALRNMGEGPVTVNINSPGGDMFEGLAIYNLLREHPGEVTVKVLGLAASAASVIAMAGDTVQIARAGFYMVHNAWVVAEVDAESISTRQGQSLWRHLITEVNPELGLMSMEPENPDSN